MEILRHLELRVSASQPTTKDFFTHRNRATISHIGMHPECRLSLLTILLLIISFGNLDGIGLALWHHNSDSESVRDRWGRIAIVFLTCSQLLALIFLPAWLPQWMRFYPGNPVQIASIYWGLALSPASFVMACLGQGLKRLMGITIAFSTALLWFFAAFGSAVV
ncbi:MAG: hypothetical protein QOJ41_1574 [Acidobacteriaceae bacterium]|jgi:hypothetical protein|nr:hypothetical protein [Acidobacteriaceae bacterium]